MKRQKKLMLMALALALLLGCYGLVTLLTAPEDVTEEPDTSVSLGIADGLTAMGWTYEDVTVDLTYSDSKWQAKNDAECPVDQTQAKALVTKAAALAAQRVITQPDDLSTYGFDSDETVTLYFTKDGSTVTLKLGNTDPYGTNTYVLCNNDQSQVYLVPTDSLTPFVLTLYDLVAKETLPTFTDVLNLAISGANELELAFVDGGSDQCYSALYEWFLQKDSKLLPLDAEAVESLLDTLTTLTWGDCVSYNADADALAKYGLDAPALVLSVLCDADTTGETATIQFGKYDEEAKAYYARLAGSKMVYLVSSSMYDTLSKASYDDLRAMDILYLDWYEVKDMEITMNGSTALMNFVEVMGTDGKTSLMYDLNGAGVDTALGTAFLNALGTTQAEAAGKTADGDVVLTLSLRQSTKATRNVITFAVSGDGYVVQVDGQGDLWITAAQYKTITDAYAAMQP